MNKPGSQNALFLPKLLAERLKLQGHLYQEVSVEAHPFVMKCGGQPHIQAGKNIGLMSEGEVVQPISLIPEEHLWQGYTAWPQEKASSPGWGDDAAEQF